MTPTKRGMRVIRKPRAANDIDMQQVMDDNIRATTKALGVPVTTNQIIYGGSGASDITIGGGAAGGSGIVTITKPNSVLGQTWLPQDIYDETNVLEGGEVIVTHRLNDCDGYWCCIHNPSPHHMRGWKQTFNFPMKAIMRVCPVHGDEHPDPDDRDYRGRHTCTCGCCSPKGKVTQRRLKRKVAA